MWCGDPQLRPCLDGVAWFDIGGSHALAESAIIAGEPSVGEWRRAIATAADRLLADGVDHVVLLWVGATAVLSALDALVSTGSKPMTFVPRSPDGLPADGLAPTEADLIADGLYSTSVAVFDLGRSAGARVVGIQPRPGASKVGQVLSRAAQIFGANECSDESIGVGRWRWNSAAPALLDVAGYEASSPWTLDANAAKRDADRTVGQSGAATGDGTCCGAVGRRAHTSLPSGRSRGRCNHSASRRRLLGTAARTMERGRRVPCLACAAVLACIARRSDLICGPRFPIRRAGQPSRSGRWCRGAFTFDDVPLLLNSPQHERSPVIVADRLRDDGLNLVGYFTRQSGLGDVVRRIGEAIAQADVAHSTVATQRTASPSEDAAPIDNRIEFTNSVCVVTADQFPFLADDFPQLFAATRRMIGYWFWELEHVPLHMRQSIALVDEIWAGSRFVTDAFAAVSPVPVRHVPIPVAEPQAVESTAIRLLGARRCAGATRVPHGPRPSQRD